MRRRVRRYQRPSAAEEDDLRQALDALSAADLRTAVRAILDELGEDVRATIVDRLVARAAKGATGWRPARASRGSSRTRSRLPTRPAASGMPTLRM